MSGNIFKEAKEMQISHRFCNKKVEKYVLPTHWSHVCFPALNAQLAGLGRLKTVSSEIPALAVIVHRTYVSHDCKNCFCILNACSLAKFFFILKNSLLEFLIQPTSLLKFDTRLIKLPEANFSYSQTSHTCLMPRGQLTI